MKPSEKSWNSEQKQSPSLKDIGLSFFAGFPLYRAVKALHLQAIMTSRDKVVWLRVTGRLSIAQWCNIKQTSVFLVLNAHISLNSWQMLFSTAYSLDSTIFHRFYQNQRKLHEPTHHAAVCMKFLAMWNTWTRTTSPCPPFWGTQWICSSKCAPVLQANFCWLVDVKEVIWKESVAEIKVMEVVRVDVISKKLLCCVLSFRNPQTGQ